MPKSKNSVISSSQLSDEELVSYYKEAAMESLLYWANSTTQLLGANATLTLLTEMLAAGIQMLVPPNQVTRAEDTILTALDDAFANVKNAKVSSTNSDKSDMN